MVTVLGREVKKGGHDTAMAIPALCIGGRVVARSMNDRELSDGLREAAKKVALELGDGRPARRNQSDRNGSRNGLIIM